MRVKYAGQFIMKCDCEGCKNLPTIITVHDSHEEFYCSEHFNKTYSMDMLDGLAHIVMNTNKPYELISGKVGCAYKIKSITY